MNAWERIDDTTSRLKVHNGPDDSVDQLVRQSLGHLRGLVDILGPCDNFDHHGYCQTHFIESPCRVGKAREFLESFEYLSNATGEGRGIPRTLDPVVGSLDGDA